jgi:hypothetical protein
MWLRHDSHGPATLKNAQILGSDSPLEFDEDGYAEVDDDDGRQLVAMHTHVERATPPGHGEVDSEPDAVEAFDAEAFVDRTPMAEVVDDIESGDVDAHLDAIESAEAGHRDREGVADAIAERREA